MTVSVWGKRRSINLGDKRLLMGDYNVLEEEAVIEAARQRHSGEH
jgi:hypothetical protein